MCLSVRFSAVIYFLFCVSANPQVTLPTDVSKKGIYCSYSPKPDDWSKSSVPPSPNNISFDPDSECDFYVRAEEMFSWLTSPPKAGSGYIFTSPLFHGVSPAQKNGRRLFQEPGVAGIFDVALSQLGSNDVPTVFDNEGRPHNLVRPKYILNDVGSRIAIQRARTRSPASSDLPLFFDTNGKEIKYNAFPTMFDFKLNRIAPSVNAQMILANGARYPLDMNGNAIDYGVGQAKTKAALMTQGRRLVYYGILVNDVYAYYHKSMPDTVPRGFPTTKTEIDALSMKYGYSFPDAEALAVAVKTSWIEAEDDEKDRYLTIDAEIPIYRRYSKYCMEYKKKKRHATLALVGMHVAFSAKEQPKMIWATFEHVDNSRSRPYLYFTDRAEEPQPYEDGEGMWLFSKDGDDDKDVEYNVPRMGVDKIGNIVGEGGAGDCHKHSKYQKTIGASDIRRDHAWGSDESKENTNTIRINTGFMEKLPIGDVRRNYIMVGTTWFGAFESIVGATKLANSTMETFISESQCLSCHIDPRLSHIWKQLQRLPK